MELEQNKEILANKCAIVCGAPIDNYTWFKNCIHTYDYIIAADSGYDHLKSIDITPNVLIGDLDSIKVQPQNVKTLIYPTKKDDTDFSICLKYCLDNCITAVDVYGAWGNRADHSLGAIFSMLKFHKLGVSITMVTPKSSMFIVSKNTVIKKPQNSYVSLFSIGGNSCGVTLEGFEYTLNNAVLEDCSPLGVSNNIVDEYGKINIESGNILVVIQNK